MSPKPYVLFCDSVIPLQTKICAQRYTLGITIHIELCLKSAPLKAALQNNF